MKKPITVAVLAAAFVLATGVAAAFTGSADHTSPGSSGSATVGALSDSPSNSLTEPSDTGSNDTGSNDTPNDGGGENHGSFVSSAAHTCPTGPEHGACVSAVAQGDDGKTASETTESSETEQDNEGTESESPTNDKATQSTEDSSASTSDNESEDSGD